jgi:hypothetical protein
MNHDNRMENDEEEVLADHLWPDGVIRLVVNNTSQKSAVLKLTPWFHGLFADIQDLLRQGGSSFTLWVDTNLSVDEEMPGGSAEDLIPYDGDDWRTRVLRKNKTSVRVPGRQLAELAWYFSIRNAGSGESSPDPDTIERLMGRIEALLRTKKHLACLVGSVPPAVTCANVMTVHNTAEPVFFGTPYSVDDLAEVYADLCATERYRLVYQDQEAVVSGQSVYRVITPWPEYRASGGAKARSIAAWRAWANQQELACGSRYVLVTREEADAILANASITIDPNRPISCPGLDEEVPGLGIDDDMDDDPFIPNANRILSTNDPTYNGEAHYVLTFIVNGEIDSDWGWPLLAKLAVFVGGMQWYVHYYFPRVHEYLAYDDEKTPAILPSIRVREEITATVLQEFPFINKNELIVLDTENVHVYPDGSVSIVDLQHEIFTESGCLTTMVIPIDPSAANTLKYQDWTEWDCALLNSTMRHLLKTCFDVPFDVRFTGLVDVSWAPRSLVQMRKDDLVFEMGENMNLVNWRGFVAELSDHDALNRRATVAGEPKGFHFRKARCHTGQNVAFVYVRYWVFGNVFVIRDEWTDFVFKKTGQISVGDITKYEVAGALDEQMERACRVLRLSPKYRPDLYVDGALDSPTIPARYPGII